MIGYYVLGKKKVLIDQIICEQIGSKDYDIVLVDSELSIIGGAFINCAKEKQVFIMQDGLYDMTPRKNFPEFKVDRLLLGYLLAHMGYFNPVGIYKIKETVNCKKLISHANLITYKNFKEIVLMFDFESSQLQSFRFLVQKTFPLISHIRTDEFDTIIFTNEFHAFTDKQNYYESLHRWLSEEMKDKRIMIKKHPRDTYGYDWPDLNINFIDESLPAEILTYCISDKIIVYMYISTSILTVLDSSFDYTVLFFKCVNSNHYIETFRTLQERLKIDDSHVVPL